MMKIGLLASGNLGFEMAQELTRQHQLQFIATDRHSKEIIELANHMEIRLFIGNPRQGNLASFLENETVDLLLSINYLFIIGQDVIQKARYPVNFHGSLLPKYRGRTPHVWAIINNESETGVTAHLIDEGCDTGSIVLQHIIAIEQDDTGYTLLQKFSGMYTEMVEEVIGLVKADDLKVVAQSHENATFFGKRTPADGRINWDWQKERIRNWVRAQSFPYPGAFTHAGKHKVIFDWIEFDTQGFNYDMANGLVISLDPLRVKTPNGVIRITKIREGMEFLETDNILG